MTRFSVPSLMVLVLVFAVGFSALRNANHLWAGLSPLVALCAVGAAVLGSAILRGSERYRSAGFALFAGVYLVLALAPWISEITRPMLGTAEVLGRVHDVIRPTADITAAERRAFNARRRALLVELDASQGSRPADRQLAAELERELDGLDRVLGAGTLEDFERVGQSLLTLSAGLIGATIGGWLYARRGRGETERPATADP